MRIVLLATIILSLAKSECPASCKCHTNDVFCVGNGKTPVPSDVPWAMTSLYFRNYTIVNRTLLSSHINGTNITQILTMESVGIEYIEDGAFASLPLLKMLDLDSNSLSFIDGEDFRGLGQLRELYLCKNKLTTLNNSFIYLENLAVLDLTGNFISQLHSGMFSGIKRYLQLIVSSNNISSLSGEGHTIDSYFSKIDLSNNPLNKSGIELATKSAFYIDLSRIGYISIPFISAALTGLSLANNRIKSVQDIDLVKLSGDHRRFRQLGLENNDIAWIQYESLTSFESLANLRLSNNRLKHVSFQLPQQLRELSLDGNDIKEIPAFSFSNATRISFLVLNHNAIDTLYSCSFCSLTELNILNLKNNLIKVLPEGVFMNLDSLHTLYLENNRIQKMESRCFIGIVALKELSLSFLTSEIDFEEDVFDDLESLTKLKMPNSPHLAHSFLKSPRIYHRLTEITTLDISYNNLSTLDSSISKTFTRLQSIDLSVNQWSCDSNLLWLSDWMKSKPHLFLFLDDLNCSFPREMVSTPISKFSDFHHQSTSKPLTISYTTRHYSPYPDTFSTSRLLPSTQSYKTTLKSDSGFFTWGPNLPLNGIEDIKDESQLHDSPIYSIPSIGIIFGYSVLGIVMLVLCIAGSTFGFHFYYRKRKWFSASIRFPGFIFGNDKKGISVGYENVLTGEQDLLEFDN